jgi:hypothetical protein
MLKTAIGSVGDISAPKKHSVNKVYIDPIKFSSIKKEPTSADEYTDCRK